MKLNLQAYIRLARLDRLGSRFRDQAVSETRVGQLTVTGSNANTSTLTNARNNNNNGGAYLVKMTTDAHLLQSLCHICLFERLNIMPFC